MRHFYTNLVGLEETFFKDTAEHGWLTYKIGPTQLVFIRGKDALPVPEEFARQPGYEGGVTETTSWVIEVPEAQFAEVTDRLNDAPIPIFGEGPYENEIGKLMVVRDPMGFTIEIYAKIPEES